MMQSGSMLFLNEHQVIRLEDDDDILLSVVTDGRVADTFTVDYPSAGYGGGELYLSPLGQHLVFSYFSGESEEAFLLLKIVQGHLEPLYSSGYRNGEGTSYAFLAGESLLLETLRTGWWCEDTAETDQDGRAFYRFGEIRLLDIGKGAMEVHAVRVYPPSGWEKNEDEDEGEFRILEAEEDLLRLEAPWGEETVSLPLDGDIIFTL